MSRGDFQTRTFAWLLIIAASSTCLSAFVYVTDGTTPTGDRVADTAVTVVTLALIVRCFRTALLTTATTYVYRGITRTRVLAHQGCAVAVELTGNGNGSRIVIRRPGRWKVITVFGSYDEQKILDRLQTAGVPIDPN